jgi:hypothetical protein
MPPDGSTSGWSGFNTIYDTAPPTQPVTPQSNEAPGGWSGFSTIYDTAPPAQPVTPQSKPAGQGILQTAHDLAYGMAANGVDLGKTGVGLLQLVARPDTNAPAVPARAKPTGLPVNTPDFTPPPEPVNPLGTTPQQIAAGQQTKAQEAASLLGLQQRLSNTEQGLTNQISPEGQAELNSSLNPLAKDSAYTHPLVQTALLKAGSQLPTLLAALIPGTFAAKIAARGIEAAAATGAATNAGLSAGSVMSAASDVVNQTTDADMRNPRSALYNPTYAALRAKGTPVGQAKAALVDKITGVLPLVAGAVGAMAGNISGGTVARLVGKGATDTLLRRAASEGLANAAGGAAMMGSTTAAADQSAANINGSRADWHDVLMQSAKGAFLGMSMGSLVGALSRHAPEVLAKGSAEHVATPEGAAVNAATHADMGTTPGAAPAPPPNMDEEVPEDYYDHHGDEDEEPAPAKPQQPNAAQADDQKPATPAGVDEAQASAIRAATEPAETKLVTPAEATVAPAAVEKIAALAPAPSAPKPYIMPFEGLHDPVPVAKPADVEAATKLITSRAARMLRAMPGVSSSEEGAVSHIVNNLVAQAHAELPYHDGPPVEMVKQFAATKPLQDRIGAALSDYRNQRDEAVRAPDAEPEAYGPAAVDTSEAAAQSRVRSQDLYKPGNEGELLSRINDNESNTTTYARAKAMVAERGGAAHPVYQDVLDLNKGRGGDNRFKQIRLDRARGAERAYLKAEAERHDNERPPAEHELLQQEPPPLGRERDDAFWARVQRAVRRGEDAGTPMPRGSFLYRAAKALDGVRADRGPDALPDKVLTAKMRNDEFLARANEPGLANNKDIDTLGHVSLSGRDAAHEDDDEPTELYKRDGAAPEPLNVKSTNARNDPSRVKRGAEAMTGRLRLQQGLNKDAGIHSDDIRDVEDFLHFLGPHLTKDTGLSVRANAGEGVHGMFDPKTRIVNIYKKTIADGELTRTAVHELWHSVETALTLRDKIALRKEYAKQYAKFITKKPWMENFGAAQKDGTRGLNDVLTGKNAQDFVARYGGNESIMDQVRVTGAYDKPVVSLIPTTENYRFFNWHEYFAETMSDKYFKMRDLEDERVRSIVGHLRSFIQVIKSRIARLFGGDVSGRIYEGFANKQFSHRQEALQAYDAIQFARQLRNNPKNIIQGVQPSLYDPVAKAIRDAFNSNTTPMNMVRSGLAHLASGQDLARAGEKLFDWTPTTRTGTESTEPPSHTFQNALNHMATHAQHFADKYAGVQHTLLRYMAKAKPDDAANFSEVMAHSTHYNYDPARAPNSKAKPKTATAVQRLERHREGHANFKKLSPEAQHTLKLVRDALHKARYEVAEEAVRATITEAHQGKMREALAGNTLVHPGTTLRIDRGEIERQTQRYMNRAETDADKDFFGGAVHKILNTQRRAPFQHENYFPERRYGTHAVEYWDQRPEEHSFSNEQDMLDFAKNTDLYIKGSSTKHFDAAGNEIDKDDPAAPPIARSEYVARTQNHGLEFFDTPAKAKARVAELRNHPANKYKVHDAAHTNRSLQSANNISPAMLGVLKSALGKTAQDGNDMAAIDHALNEAIVNLLPPNSVRYGALRRRNVMGASKDTLRVVHDYFLGAANTVGRLKYGGEADNALLAMHEHTEAMKDANDGMTHVRQELVKAADLRRKVSPLDIGTSSKALNFIRVAQQYAFVNYMTTAAFNMVQLAQPWMTGMPYLGARYGIVAANREMGKALARLGFGGGVIKEGAMQEYNAIRNAVSKDFKTNGDYVSIIKARLARIASTPAEKALAAEHSAMLDKLSNDSALGHSGAGLQVRQMLTMPGKSVASRALHAAEEATRAMPTAIEVANRAMLGIATYELHKAKTGDKDLAYQEARKAIKETQADYGAPNAPLIMQGSRHPYLSPFFTFKKYAQMIYSLIGTHLYQWFAGEDKETRRIARRTMANTLFMHAMVTGMHGLPIGVVLTTAAVVSLLLGEDKSFNYDQWLHEMGGKLGLTPKEIDVFANGLPTMAGVNATGRMGLSSLVLDDAPTENDWGGWTQWVGDQLLGAPGQVLGEIPQAMSNIRHGNFDKAAINLMPAAIRDKLRAINYAEHGIVNNEGDQLAPPLPWNQVLGQALGWEPDTVEETYAARDAGLAAKDTYRQGRATVLEQFSAQYAAGDYAGAQQTLSAYNATVPGSVKINFSTALKYMRTTDKAVRSGLIGSMGFTKKEGYLATPMGNYNLPQQAP